MCLFTIRAFFLVAMAAIAISSGRIGPLTAAEPVGELSPEVSRLVELSARGNEQSAVEFQRSVARLGSEKQWNVKGLAADSPFPVDLKLLVLSTDGKKHVVLAIHYLPLVVPGPDVQLLLLLAPDGRLVDRLSCEVSSRLTATAIEEVRYDVRRDSDPKRSEELVSIYLTGKKGDAIAPNFAYTLQHGDTSTKLKLPPQTGDEAWTLDLCHCRVKEGKFEVAAPAGKR
jgi:hypothetical protein